MGSELPDYYFRIRDNGAVVFRVDTENRQRRIDMVEIAVVNIKNGNIKPHGDTELSAADMAAINDWVAERQAVLTHRETDDILRAVDYLNTTTQWVQSKATRAQLDLVSDKLMLAMHDLRLVLVRKKSERLHEEMEAASAARDAAYAAEQAAKAKAGKTAAE